MCNLYSITTNQEAIRAFFRVINRYVGNLPPMPSVFRDYPAPVIRNTEAGTEMTMMSWGHQLSPPGSFAMALRSLISMHRAQINSPSPAGGARTISSSGANSSSQ
jgi:hypothetical protein